jgi:hypothetical protein
VLLKKSVRICGEELRKAARALVVAHEAVRELDRRTLRQALLFFKIW